MSRLDELPPDQRAALSLLLRQRKSYAEVARCSASPSEPSTTARMPRSPCSLHARRASCAAERREEVGRLPARPAGQRGRATAHPHLSGRLRAGAGLGPGDQRRAGTAGRLGAARDPRAECRARPGGHGSSSGGGGGQRPGHRPAGPCPSARSRALGRARLLRQARASAGRCCSRRSSWRWSWR